MKLYNVPRHTLVRVLDEDCPIPPEAPEIKKDNIIFLDHLDGMYSFCYDSSGRICHMFAGTEVEIVPDAEVKRLIPNSKYLKEKWNDC